LAASPAAARTTDVSLPCPCPRTTLVISQWRDPAGTRDGIAWARSTFDGLSNLFRRNQNIEPNR
jgi:hypothetical protein